MGSMRRVRCETASSLILSFTHIYFTQCSVMILILVTPFGRPVLKVSKWSASLLPVLLWHYFICLILHVLVIERIL